MVARSPSSDVADVPGTAAGCLAGADCWIITDGKAGHDTQAKGVAEALGVRVVMKPVAPKGPWRWAAPWGPVSPAERFGEAGSAFAPPWPAVAIAVGRASIPYIRALKRRAGPATFTVVLEDPRAGRKIADFLWVPMHDPLRGPNVLATPTSPHTFRPGRLTRLRERVPDAIAALPRPRVAVILGGKNAVYRFKDHDDDRLARALRSLGALGASFMITTSRRTHARLLSVVDQATAGRPRILYTGEGANPYPEFLAHADVLVVTADSVNMTGEACATGRPVYVFKPSGGSGKFDRFHAALNRHGATRELPDHVDVMPDWSYTPLDSSGRIAEEIEQRFARRAAMLPGLVVLGRADGGRGVGDGTDR
jgi:hypothetical protein